MEGPAFESGSLVTHLCWLAPEEQLMVASEAVVHIHDIITGRVLHRFSMSDPVSGVAYSQKLNQLAIAAGSDGTITIIDPQTGVSLVSCHAKQPVLCLAFSQATKEIVCGVLFGLPLFDLTTQHWRYFERQAILKSISTLPNGTIVVNTEGTGVQLLSLGEGCTMSSQPIMQKFGHVKPFDEDRIIATIPPSGASVILLELATMRQLLVINTWENHKALANLTAILCASLENSMAVHCFKVEGKENLQLWRFCHQLAGWPVWTVRTDQPLIGRISPAGTRLVIFHQTHICIRDVGDGGLLAELLLESPSPPCPLDITFNSEDQFYFHYDTYHIPHVLVTSSKPGTPSHSVTRSGQLPSVLRPWEGHFSMDDKREWVVSGSRRICWIPPGYIGFQINYCWAGSTLVMIGEDCILRKITFQE